MYIVLSMLIRYSYLLILLIVHFEFSALVCVSLGQDVTVKLDISESQVHTGANITLNCRIQGIGPGEIVYWSKVGNITY